MAANARRMNRRRRSFDIHSCRRATNWHAAGISARIDEYAAQSLSVHRPGCRQRAPSPGNVDCNRTW
jgi:hypothetical protein